MCNNLGGTAILPRPIFGAGFFVLFYDLSEVNRYTVERGAYEKGIVYQILPVL